MAIWRIFGLTWNVGCVPRTHRLGLIGDQALQKTLTFRQLFELREILGYE